MDENLGFYAKMNLYRRSRHSKSLKRNLTFISEPINGTERDCANQKLETKQYYDGKWNDEVYIEEPYKEGCSLVNDKGARTPTIEHCYCQGDLCNSSNQHLQMKYITMLMTVITTFKII